jgi:hypothetical protein
MKTLITIVLTLSFWVTLNAQNKNEYSSIDKTMLQIPKSLTTSSDGIARYINSKFSNNNDKARAVYIWVASNIQYDVENMFVQISELTTNEIIAKTLKTQKGVCTNFAVLFNDIALKSGITSYTIPGYTKQNEVVDNLPHEWCAANIDGTWYIFDPTWGSGFLQKGKFVSKINDFYFKVTPEDMISSHMPFDPLWQFSNYPVTCQEFYEGKTQRNTSKPYFNFKDSLSVYANQPEIEQLISSSKRIEANGVKNSLIYDRLRYNRREIEVYRNNVVVDQLNSAGNSFNAGINHLNEFIHYRNNQFTPKKSDGEIRQMIDTIASSFKFSQMVLDKIKPIDVNMSLQISQLNRSINEATLSLNEHQAFVEKYIRTGKLFRKSLFYKTTFLGMPLK